MIDPPLLQAVLDAIKGTIDTSTNIADHPNVKFAQMERLKLEKRAEHAEAALLSLQTQLRAVVNAAGRATSFIHELDIYRKGIATLLPDPAGTTAPKNDDALARVDRRG